MHEREELSGRVCFSHDELTNLALISFWNPLLPIHMWVIPRQWSNTSAPSSSLCWEPFASHLPPISLSKLFYIESILKTQVLEIWIGRDIRKSSNPSFSLKVRISSTCTFQEKYLFNLFLKSLPLPSKTICSCGVASAREAFNVA